MAKKKEVIEGSGTVYRDLGLKNPDEALLKAKLASHIFKILKIEKLTQTEAAKLLRIDQPRVSDLICGRLRRFSTDKLFEFLQHLGHDVEIRVRPKSRADRAGEIRVLAS